MLCGAFGLKGLEFRQRLTSPGLPEPSAENKKMAKIIEVISKKEIVVLQKTTNDIGKQVEVIKINSQPTLLVAQELLIRIKKGKEFVETKKKSITDPLNQALKATRELFYPIETALTYARSLIDTKILDYRTEIKKVVEQKKEEIAIKVENGAMKFEVGAQKIEKQEEKIDSFNIRKIREVEIVDETKIPRAYLLPNIAKIKKALLEEGIEVPGTRIIVREITIAK